MPVTNPAAHEFHGRGLALIRSSREREAISCLREAVALSPDDAAAHYHLGIAHRLLGELEEARAALRTALEVEPTLAPACAQLGGLALVSGGLEEALRWFSRALTLEPGHRVSRYQMGIALRFAETSFVTLGFGVGASGATRTMDDAATFPIEARFEIGRGVRVLGRARATFLAGADSRQDGARFADELEAMLAIRIGRAYTDWGFPTGNG
jgi:tetratricopeptide (TPR) repeat protein